MVIGSLRAAPYNSQEILKILKVDTEGDPLVATHHSWVTQLTLSGPATLAVSMPGTYMVTIKDYLGNSLSTFDDTITIQTTDANGDKQTIPVPITNGSGTFQFSAAAAGTYTLSGTGQTQAGTPYDCNTLEVVVS